MSEPAQQIMEQTTSGVMYGSSTLGIVLAFFDAHAAGICAMVAVAGFIVNWWYRHKESKK